jgi:signal transduction histidine kinase
MRERAEMMGGRIEFVEGTRGGALVRISIPAAKEEEHVPAGV